MTIYIASSWKNQHAVEMLTYFLRDRGHEVRSFIENRGDEEYGAEDDPDSFNLDKWIASDEGADKFLYDTNGATTSDLVIYLGPSGTDAWAEVGAAWASKVPVIGLWAKGEPAGLMRLMVEWYGDYQGILVRAGRV